MGGVTDQGPGPFPQNSFVFPQSWREGVRAPVRFASLIAHGKPLETVRYGQMQEMRRILPQVGLLSGLPRATLNKLEMEQWSFPAAMWPARFGMWEAGS